MPVTVRNQPGDGDMAAADAAVRDALRARSGVVLDRWLERIARPLRWAHSQADGSADFAGAALAARAMTIPGEVTLEDCTVARAALEAFAITYDPVFVRPDILRMLPADQPVLKTAVEVVREHAKPLR